MFTFRMSALEFTGRKSFVRIASALAFLAASFRSGFERREQLDVEGFSCVLMLGCYAILCSAILLCSMHWRTAFGNSCMCRSFCSVLYCPANGITPQMQ